MEAAIRFCELFKFDWWQQKFRDCEGLDDDSRAIANSKYIIPVWLGSSGSLLQSGRHCSLIVTKQFAKPHCFRLYTETCLRSFSTEDGRKICTKFSCINNLYGALLICYLPKWISCLKRTKTCSSIQFNLFCVRQIQEGSQTQRIQNMSIRLHQYIYKRNHKLA